MPKTIAGTLEELCSDLATKIRDSAENKQTLRMIGFAGAPGAGKSEAVSMMLDFLKDDMLGASPLVAGIIPMDGFHKSNAVLQRENLRDLKGVPDSFDVVGFLMTLDRARDASTVVYAPGYSRQLNEPIAASHRVERRGIVFTEGNYLACQDGPWSMVREAIDLLIYLDVPEETTHSRLLRRHRASGKSLEEAEDWIARVDAPNRLLVEASRTRADRIWLIES